MRSNFLGKLLQRVEHLGAEEMQVHLVRLAREYGYLETIFNALQDGIVVLSEQGLIDYHNAAACKMLPLPTGQAVGQPIQRYLRELPWKEMLVAGQSLSRRIEVSYPEHKVLDFFLLPLGMATDGGEASHVAIFHDVTLQARDTLQQIESERLNAITLLAAGVAHELGNPINSLNIHLQLMQRDLRRLPESDAVHLRESIAVARREIDRLDAIIHQFLRAIRPTMPEFVMVNLADLVEETLQALGPELDDRGMLVTFTPSASLPQVMADPGQIKQCIYNIVRNAMQASGEAGMLQIVLRPATKGGVEMEFRDNGCGIAAEEMSCVMDPYYTTKKTGSGLGLMIVHRIVREHGAELQLESSVGKGTVVRILFPSPHAQVKLLEAGT